MQNNPALVLVPPPPLKFTLNQWHLNNVYRYEIRITELIDKRGY